MKKIVVFLTLICLFSCKTKEVDKRVISVTIEPQRYFAEKIAGDRFQINCVVPTGQSPETYDPTPQQMVEIGKSEAYFRIGYIGFELAWMEHIAQNNQQLKIVDLSEGMELITNHWEHGDHYHGAVDPHLWTSFNGAKKIILNMLNAFIVLDPENKSVYQANYTQLIKEIEETQKEVDALLKPLLSRTFIIYHPALTYLAGEYNLTQLCIEMDGKEPSPVQLKELVDTAKNHNVRVVFVQQEFDRKNGELIAQETGCRLVTINPLNYDWSQEMIHIAKALADEEVN
ncbi:zinc ABC transporter substrate-binding protein [Parabacteroides sp. PF5-9]|uniref:metal ABC transporter solute-binding protein, Zn/Mn family n=1 Tax=Parabacteroides sp. PF5-9 TaxID=1742404 RepID=UPI0024734B9B|nr:zinc ABC transporter substrate-binding protein [Parabacteroides sp. PF5-9]MDH6357913.1 zinc transport system substrate-binding protein [Parabacteroides sp. PF5-9]